MKKINIWAQKRGFGVELPATRKEIDWDGMVDALLELPNVCEVDGPLINGVVGVMYDGETRPDAELIAELDRVCRPFVR